MTTVSERPRPPGTHALDPAEIARFHREGYLAPLTLCDPEEMAVYRRRIYDEVLGRDPPRPRDRRQSRHLDDPTVYALCSHPAIADAMASLMGRDLVLWRSYLFDKGPGVAEIPWHQDVNYWPIEPPINVTAWVAIDEATTENACPQVIPRSHRRVVPHVERLEGQAFLERAHPDYYDEGQAVDIELQPGQFFLFTERLLHHSPPNRSDRPRLGLAVRVTVPFVRVDHDQIFEGHGVILLRGEDAFGFNRRVDPPAR